MIPENARKSLEKALKTGGDVLKGYRDRRPEARIKESISSVVTEADLASEKAILECLRNAHHGYTILSEEAGHLRPGSPHTWVVDPLDGTSNFAAGLPWYGVIITLFRGREPVLGGMYMPEPELLYLAEAGRGATRNGQPIRCTDAADPAGILISYSFDFSTDPGKTAGEMDLLGKLSRRIRNTRSTNSLVDFCYTADGRLGAAINQTTRIWDIAAPWLVIREAGGIVTDVSGREIAFDLSEGAGERNYTILAAGPKIHREVLDLIAERRNHSF